MYVVLLNCQPINTRWDGAREEVKLDYCQLPKIMGNPLESYTGTRYQEIVRVDSPWTEVFGSQWHSHGKNGGAINQDGSLRDRNQKFAKSTLKWLKDHS